jgi:hypothetical protein
MQCGAQLQPCAKHQIYLPEAISKVTGAIARDPIERSVEYIRKYRWWTFWNGVDAVFDYGIAPLTPFIFGDDNEVVKVGTMFYAGDVSGIMW